MPGSIAPALRKPLIGLAIGVAVGLFDYFLFVALGVRMTLGRHDLTLAICGLFAATYGVLGYVNGRLAATQAELRASAALIADSQRRALQAEKLAEIGQLAAGVAHEVRNPLGVIRSSTAMLIEDLPAGSDAARAGSFIVEEVDRLNAVVRALLDYARPLAPRRERLRLAGLVNGVRPLVEEVLRRNGVTLRAGADEVEIAGDPDLLAQLLLTLIENAAQAMPGGGAIEVALRRVGGAVELRVADDGPGVDAAVAGQIFEPFFTTRAEGTGLGLALAARVAQAHGGDLSLRPGEGIGAGGRGACFVLRIGGVFVTPQIAVLDDEARMTEVLAMLLRREGYEVRCFTDPQVCLAAVGEQGFDLLFTDLKMPGMDGIAVLKEARRIAPEMPVVLMTAHASVATALAAVRAGAFDYVEKPFDNDACRALAQRALEVVRLQRDNRYLKARLRQLGADDEVVTASPAMREVFALAARAARSRATALVCGESGTGKELVARAIHRHSDRAQGPFVAVNCKAFAGGVLESELFGHEKGAYTGASQTRAGVFERADGGTLLLDEIGEVDLEFQAKLLRVLQTREVLPVGGSRARAVDVRVVAATNRDLRAEVAAGRFREDLYFRLAVIPIRLPPLRERPEDILPLARHFLARWSAELGRRLDGWTPEVEAWLLRHGWPGNVRELENLVERAAVLARDDRISLEDLLLEAGPGPGGDEDGGEELTLQAHLDRAAERRIRGALARCEGRRAEAARSLGVERTTLYRLMKKFGIDGEGPA